MSEEVAKRIVPGSRQGDEVILHVSEEIDGLAGVFSLKTKTHRVRKIGTEAISPPPFGVTASGQHWAFRIPYMPVHQWCVGMLTYPVKAPGYVEVEWDDRSKSRMAILADGRPVDGNWIPVCWPWEMGVGTRPTAPSVCAEIIPQIVADKAIRAAYLPISPVFFGIDYSVAKKLDDQLAGASVKEKFRQDCVVRKVELEIKSPDPGAQNGIYNVKEEKMYANLIDELPTDKLAEIASTGIEWNGASNAHDIAVVATRRLGLDPERGRGLEFRNALTRILVNRYVAALKAAADREQAEKDRLEAKAANKGRVIRTLRAYWNSRDLKFGQYIAIGAVAFGGANAALYFPRIAEKIRMVLQAIF